MRDFFVHRRFNRFYLDDIAADGLERVHNGGKMINLNKKNHKYMISS